MKIIERADYLESLQNVRLTPIGTELVPIVQELTAWASKNLPTIMNHVCLPPPKTAALTRLRPRVWLHLR